MDKEKDFDWGDLGDIGQGRPTLGPWTNVAAYRLLYFTLRQVLNSQLGKEKSKEIFIAAGKLAGEEIFHNLAGSISGLNDLMIKVADLFDDLKIGIFKVEKADEKKTEFILTISEDLDCSGVPVDGETKCAWDEGLIAGILSSFLRVMTTAKEIDCWATGAGICRFEVKKDM